MSAFLVKLQAHSLYTGTAQPANPAGFQRVLFFLQQYPHGDIFSAVSDPVLRRSYQYAEGEQLGAALAVTVVAASWKSLERVHKGLTNRLASAAILVAVSAT